MCKAPVITLGIVPGITPCIALDNCSGRGACTVLVVS